MEERILVGGGRIIKTKYGDLPKITFHRDNLKRMLEYIDANKTDFVTLAMKEKRNQQEGKASHYLEIDTWVKEEQRQPVQNQQIPQAPPVPDDGTNDLPF